MGKESEVSCGNCLPTFRDNVSVSSSRVKSPRRRCGSCLPTFRNNVWVPSSWEKSPRRRVVIAYRRFGTTYRSHLQGQKPEASCGNCLSTFRDNVWVPCSRVKNPRRRVVIVYRRFGTTYRSHLGLWLLTREDGTDTLSRNVDKQLSHDASDFWPVNMGLIRCPETSVKNYHTTPRNIPEERRSHH
jgi:hypothetical protein